MPTWWREHRGTELKLTTWTDDARIAADNLADFATGLFTPTVRLGVTGLSRSGKTVFITALVHNLIHGGRLPLFAPWSEGRLARAYLAHQPDDNVPRFDYERHVATLVEDREWPHSTRQVSELRLTVEYESAGYFSRTLGRGRLNVDIVDYPGEWLLDLPLLGKTYDQWSSQAIGLARESARKSLSGPWLEALAGASAQGPADEVLAANLAESFTAYLEACRDDRHALSALPPGRFLMPGDLAGSPALTFAPLVRPASGQAPKESLWALMERRYEAYKTHVVRPFFREHFARLDRQIVLVDALAALNAGPLAVADLEAALADILACFKPGSGSWLSGILTRRIDRILFAATKADHLHHEGHARLQAVLARLVDRAVERAKFSGAAVDIVAMAAIRATREARLKHEGEDLGAILGTPLPGERVGGETYDGETEIAVFPGDLPADPEELFDAGRRPAEPETDETWRFVRFRPPKLEKTVEGFTLSLPHIRLDKGLQFLLGDRLA